MESTPNYHYQLLLKEIDLIDTTIRNLDDIIYKTKNFAIVFWGGSLYLIVQYLKAFQAANTMIFLTVLIPLIFWAMHYRWQKHLSMCAARERMISYFINGPSFEKWLAGDRSVRFPLYDVPGWIYTRQVAREARVKWQELGVDVAEEYLLDEGELRFWKILFYKDAKWYYTIMILVSILFGVMVLENGGQW